MIDKFEKALLAEGKSVLTIQAYINDIRQFFNWLKDSLGFESDSITETDVREFRQYLNLQKKLKPTSINRLQI
ncbi:phage integrase N-terminal SAM-like domain-containing protein [Ferviditalea candida]|uniref:Phage integrase N-terminal SAM-like domain-containing protein n=1 Tax=Ferviditalea candida TaxID=3108399 RepID=A0ABU5ZR26_9BACL|nr:phage integrase N-terminal SAM-like domain-containing protein [Paenibacillaceae bacterium T2]